MNKQPRVMLIDPKFPHNVGNAYRACAAWGADWLYWTGNRVDLDNFSGRLPREERMRAYRDAVHYAHIEGRPTFVDVYPGVVPVCVELMVNAAPLTTFIHPANALYVFGPEDGGVPGYIRAKCHQFVYVPTYHCLNLAATVNVVLFHRRLQRFEMGLEPMPELDEQRGFIETSPAMEG